MKLKVIETQCLLLSRHGWFMYHLSNLCTNKIDVELLSKIDNHSQSRTSPIACLPSAVRMLRHLIHFIYIKKKKKC